MSEGERSERGAETPDAMALDAIALGRSAERWADMDEASGRGD